MDPRLPWHLLWAAAFALPAALLAGPYLPAAALWAVAGLVFFLATRHPHRGAGLCALPALLAAIQPPAIDPPLPRAGPVQIDGTVTAVVRTPHRGETMVHLTRRGDPQRLHVDGDPELLPGDRLRASARLGQPAAPDLPPSLVVPAGTLQVEPGPPSLPRAFAALRRALERTLLQQFPDHRGALLASLVLGRGTRPAPELTEAHQATGLSHLLAVSGAHAAMLAWLLGQRPGGRGHRLRLGRRRTWAVVALLIVYAGITGGEPPVVRAVAAAVLGALAAGLHRRCSLATGLVVPALITCCAQPTALGSPSFVLSYAAVFGLAMTRPVADDAGPVRRWLVHPIASSFWAACTTAPLTLWWFGQLAPWTVLLTPLLAPLVGGLLLGGLLAGITGLVLPAVATAVVAMLGPLTSLYIAVVQGADWLPGTPVHATTTPPGWQMATACLCALVALERHRNRAGVVAAAVLLCVPHFVPPLRPGAPGITLFAVGHGQACLATTDDGRAAAIDCGSLEHPLLSARRVVAALTTRRLDLLVVTHGDQDHHNGVAELLRRVPIRHAMLPTSLLDHPLAALLRAHGTIVAGLPPGGDVEPLPGLRVRAPRLPHGATDNDRSLWVRVSAGGVTTLFSGDAEALGTAAALAQGLAAPSDVLVLPHHGRGNPQAPALLRRVMPRWCFASASGDDGDTTLGSIARRFGCEVRVTGRHGALASSLALPP
jgi:competence protein ComEC